MFAFVPAIGGGAARGRDNLSGRRASRACPRLVMGAARDDADSSEPQTSPSAANAGGVSRASFLRAAAAVGLGAAFTSVASSSAGSGGGGAREASAASLNLNPFGKKDKDADEDEGESAPLGARSRIGKIKSPSGSSVGSGRTGPSGKKDTGPPPSEVGDQQSREMDAMAKRMEERQRQSGQDTVSAPKEVKPDVPVDTKEE